jgi:hypothetical protein
VTVSEAAALVVDLTRELRAAQAERDAHRLVAQQAITYAHTLQRDLACTTERYHRLLDEQRRGRRSPEAA